MQPKVLFAGFEFEQEHQRGIYLYTKSLIHAIHKNHYQTGILTQTKNVTNSAMLTQIYHSLRSPNIKNLPKTKKNLAKGYIKNVIFRQYGDTYVENDSRMFTEENFWFLKEVDFFINIPSFYSLCHLLQRLPDKYSSLTTSSSGLSLSDIIFTTSPLNIKTKKTKLVQTVHDLIPMNVLIHDENPDFFYKRLKACANADKILTVSDFTRQQFLEFFPHAGDRTQTVYQPMPTDEHSLYLSSLPKVQEAVLNKYKLKSKQYMYYVGAIEARKNIHRLIQAYELATKGDQSMPLVLSGGIDTNYIKQTKLSEYFTETKYDKNGQRIPKRHNIIKTEYVTEIEKLCLIRNARAFLFPTLNEGFGIPALEGQTLGTPVLTTNNSSLPEVVGETAIMLDDPFNLEEMSFQIEKLWADDELCQSLSQSGLENAKRFSKENFQHSIQNFLKDI